MLYVPSEKMLYKWTGRGDVYVCYQKVLADSKKKDSSLQIKCESRRVRRLQNGLCEPMNLGIPHTPHENHETIANDKGLMNDMIEKCENLKINFAEDAHRIPTRHIYQREIVRYSQ